MINGFCPFEDHRAQYGDDDTTHQHHLADIIVHPKKYGQYNYINPKRRHAIQQPTASDQQRTATGVINELISTGYDGR